MGNKIEKFPKLFFKNANGIKYEIIWKCPAKSLKASGLCDPPGEPKPKIWIDPNLDEKRLMEVIIEEVTHAFWFEKTEREVRKLAAVLKKLLYKNGFKLVP